ncbi:hypothetical protein JCM11641_000012 [Rhodosporidiobolus odoratus]
MPAFSGLQLLLYGLVLSYSGISLVLSPESFLLRFGPVVKLMKRYTGLRGAATAHEGGEDGWVGMGVVLSVLGYYCIMAVYTLDEKFKRNSVSARLFTGILCYYACTSPSSPSQGSSYIALFGLFNAFTGLVMGLSVGFGDGNAVDIELKQRAQARNKAVRAEKTT